MSAKVLNLPKPRSTKPYKHLGARVLNRNTGELGRIVEALPIGKTTWEIHVRDDGAEPSNGRYFDHKWNPGEFARHNVIVAEDYTHHLPDPKARALALLNGPPLPFRHGFYTSREKSVFDEVNKQGGRDDLTFNGGWPALLCLSLWGSREYDLRVEQDQVTGWDSNGDRYAQLAKVLRAKVEAMP